MTPISLTQVRQSPQERSVTEPAGWDAIETVRERAISITPREGWSQGLIGWRAKKSASTSAVPFGLVSGMKCPVSGSTAFSA